MKQSQIRLHSQPFPVALTLFLTAMHTNRNQIVKIPTVWNFPKLENSQADTSLGK
jgi:hypothetical protein